MIWGLYPSKVRYTPHHGSPNATLTNHPAGGSLPHSLDADGGFEAVCPRPK
jgi:hypothetical protein